MKAIIFHGELTQTGFVPVLSNDESALERQIRLLGRAGVAEIFCFGVPVSERERLDQKAEQSQVRLQFPDQEISLSQLGNQNAEEDRWILLADHLVFSESFLPYLDNVSAKNFGCISLETDSPWKADVVLGKLRNIRPGEETDSPSFFPVVVADKKTIALSQEKPAKEGFLSSLVRSGKLQAVKIPKDCLVACCWTEEILPILQGETRAEIAEHTIVLSGADAYLKIPDILQKSGAKKLFLVREQGIDLPTADSYFQNLNFPVCRFVVPAGSPTEETVKQAIMLFHREKCDYIVSIGGQGASHIAKNIKLFAKCDLERPLLEQSYSCINVQHLAISTIAGEGALSTSSMIVAGERRWFSKDGLVSNIVILDAQMLQELSEAERKSFVLQAMSQAIEAVWAAKTTSLSRKYAVQSLNLIENSLFGLLRGEAAAAQEILKASYESGKAAFLSQSFSGEVLADQVAASCGILRGQALALCVSQLWEYMIKHPELAVEGLSIDHLTRSFELLQAAFHTRAPIQNALGQFRFVLKVLEMDNIETVPRLSAEEMVQKIKLEQMDNLPVVLDEKALAEIFHAILKDDEPGREHASVAGDREQLKQLQQYMLNILSDFDMFCSENDLQYYLSEGTMLGAVRHHGFIPWDDDIDVMMPRPDYDRFVKLAQKKFSIRYHLDSFETNPKHWVLGAKIQMTQPTQFYQDTTNGLADYPGPYIDIFPLDYLPAKQSGQQIRNMKHLRRLRRILWVKTGFSRKKMGKLKRVGLKLLCGVLSTKQIFRMIDRSMRKFNRKKRVYHVNYCSYYPLSKQIFPVSYFGKGVRIPFEGHSFLIPNQADYMLRTIYGKNYMNLPVLTQKQRHGFRFDPDFQQEEQKTSKGIPFTAAKPKLSFVVPVYNVEAYLPRCLDSLLAQTYPNIEIVVVNDGSPDNSQAVIDRYVQEYPQIIHSFVKENGGLSSARNFGLEHAGGEYVSFIDSDDYVTPDLAEKTMAKAVENQSDVVFFRLTKVTENSQKVQKNDYFGVGEGTVLEDPRILLAAKPFAPNKVFRRQWFLDTGLRFPVGQCFEDSAVTYNLLLMAKRIDFINESFYYYVVDRADSITNVVDKKVYDIFKSIDSFIGFYRAHGAYDTCKDVLDELCRVFIFVRLGQVVNSTDKKFALKFIRDAYQKLNEVAPDWADNPYYWLGSSKKLSKKSRVKRFFRKHAFWYSIYYRVHRLKLQKKQAALKKKPVQSVSTMETLVQLQQIQKEILSVFDRFCRQNDLTYFVAEGTLLGTVRHNGFIPWDDDVDVLMPRKDYDRFVELFGNREFEDCVMVNETTFPEYHLAFTKFISLKKYGFVNNLNHFPHHLSGPGIDIFPLDHGVKSDTKARARAIRFYRDVLLYKQKYIVPQGRRLMRKLPYYVQWCYSYKGVHRRLRKILTKYNGQDTGYLTNYASSYSIQKETFPASAFEVSVEVPFEDITVFIPSGADAVLRKIYGDYQKLPPKSKQIPHHSFDPDPDFDPRQAPKQA